MVKNGQIVTNLTKYYLCERHCCILQAIKSCHLDPAAAKTKTKIKKMKYNLKSKNIKYGQLYYLSKSSATVGSPERSATNARGLTK